MGMPPRRAYVIPTHAEPMIVSIAPMLFSVTFPYTAPKVRVGAITEMKRRKVTATVF
jgi:hypothetical protein